MRKSLRIASLLAFSTLLLTTAKSQDDRFAYAITDLNPEGGSWNVLRKLNTQTGQYTDVLLNGTDLSLPAYDAATRKKIEPVVNEKNNFPASAFSTGVAAIAFDRKNNRIWFTPMFIDQLRYIDLRTMKVYHVTDQVFTTKGTMHRDEGHVVSRMTIADDGNGYAITNDGSTFIQFTTGKKVRITQLGSLVDDPANNGVSIHSRCTSFGGDMVADDEGNLIVATARNSVFRINIESRVASYLGPVTGLPVNFSTNGMVVDENGKLLLSSATNSQAYFVVNPKDLTATEFKSAKGVYKSSDLANSNILVVNRNKTTEITTIASREGIPSNVHLYPNPVSGNRFTLRFNGLATGNYTIEITDVTGRVIKQQKVILVSEFQTESVTLNPGNTRGVYLVKVVDEGKKAVFTQKFITH